MAIEIEELKQVPQAAKEAVEMVNGATEVIVQKTEPFINWENIANSADQSLIMIALAIFLIAVFSKPILFLAKYAIIFGIILFLVQHYAA